MAEAVTIRVMCRFRPLNAKEIGQNEEFMPKFLSETSLKDWCYEVHIFGGPHKDPLFLNSIDF